MAGYVPDCPQELRASARLPWCNIQGSGTLKAGRGKVGNHFQSRRKHPLFLVSAYPLIRIEFIFDQLTPPHFSVECGMSKIPHPDSWYYVPHSPVGLPWSPLALAFLQRHVAYAR